MQIEFNDLFYVCSMIEYTARKTKNRRGIIVNALGKSGLEKELSDAGVNHCLSFEQVSDEWIENYNIDGGDFDTITNCRYTVPSCTDIGKQYAYLVRDLSDGGDEIAVTVNLFNSFLSDEISDFNTDLYYQNLSYLAECYREGRILE